MNMNRLLSFVFLLLLSIRQVQAGNWPAWRGPTGDGICAETNLPVQWSRTENVRWRIGLPEPGNSTPVIWGNKVFLTQAIGSDRMLLCLDRQDGHELWRAGIRQAEKEMTHNTNPQCSASPVTDGERVIVSFGSAGLVCYDLNGQELWRRALGTLRHIWGSGASPVLYQNLCFLNFGPGPGTCLVAVDKKSGATVWQHDEPGGDTGEKKGESKPVWIGSWSTPLIIQEQGRDALIMLYPRRVVSFDPLSGRENWSCRGLNDLVYTSPIHRGGVVVALGGFNGMAFAVRTGGRGEVTETHRLWHHPRTRQRIGSAVIHEDCFYLLTDPGVAECFEVATGRQVWENTLQGPGTTKQNWSSLMCAGDKLYSINQAGDCFVFRASPQFKMIATNSLAEKSNSSIASADGALFIRTHKNLWCIAVKP